MWGKERAKLLIHEGDIPKISFLWVEWDEFDYLAGILTKYLYCELVKSVDGILDDIIRRLRLNDLDFILDFDMMAGANAYAVVQNEEVNLLLQALLQSAVDIFNSRKYFRDS